MRDPAAILADIRKKTDLILKQQAAADRGEFTCYGAAAGLQKLRHDRRVLQAELPPLRTVGAD